jgi:hypothetical protein
MAIDMPFWEDFFEMSAICCAQAVELRSETSGVQTLLMGKLSVNSELPVLLAFLIGKLSVDSRHGQSAPHHSAANAMLNSPRIVLTLTRPPDQSAQASYRVS